MVFVGRFRCAFNSCRGCTTRADVEVEQQCGYPDCCWSSALVVHSERERQLMCSLRSLFMAKKAKWPTSLMPLASCLTMVRIFTSSRINYDLPLRLWTVSRAAAIVFAVALLASGQSSSIAASVSGQAVSTGFLQRDVHPVLRRFLTRLLAVVPCIACAVTGGRPAVNQLIVITQVALSMILPFVSAPLLVAVCKRDVMRVWNAEKQVRPTLK